MQTNEIDFCCSETKQLQNQDCRMIELGRLMPCLNID